MFQQQVPLTADKGSLLRASCFPLLYLLGSRLVLPHRSSAERSGLGKCSCPVMGMLILVRVQGSSAIHVACAFCMWLKISVCTQSDLTSFAFPHLHFHPHLQSTGNFSKELVVHPHHSMALLMGLFLPAKMSTKCGGAYSSLVSASSCTLMLLWCSHASMPCVASLSMPCAVARGGAPRGGHWFGRRLRRDATMQARTVWLPPRTLPWYLLFLLTCWLVATMCPSCSCLFQLLSPLRLLGRAPDVLIMHARWVVQATGKAAST